MKQNLAAAALALILAVPNALAAGDPQTGLVLAGRWCTGCHADSASVTASDAAPSLQHIAKIHAADTAWLRSWLASPHPPMPNLNLGRDEIDSIIAYLQQLAKTPQ